MATDSRSTMDPVTPAAIRTGFRPGCLGREIYYFDSLESTNRLLRQAASRGAREGTVILAEEQTAGRGRLNRTWESRPGVGVYLSLLLRPRVGSGGTYLFTFLPAVATARALRAVSGLPVFIQWPNDVMLRGKKIAGILSEVRTIDGQAHEIVVGVGINVNHTPADLPAYLRDFATSLAIASGRCFSRSAVIRAFLTQMERGYELLRSGNTAAVLDEWKRLCPSHYGKPVVVTGGQTGPIRGSTRGIDEQGALLLETQDGGMERIAFGELRRVQGR
ncbi:MAG: biotin--[acetyl-CoA-carboxylase] ligase [Acidobacteriota bacterium]